MSKENKQDKEAPPLPAEVTKSLQRYFNQVTVSTFKDFVGECVNIFATYPLSSVQYTLISLIVQRVTRLQLQPTMVALYAGFLCILHKEVPGSALIVAADILEKLSLLLKDYLCSERGNITQEGDSFVPQQLCLLLGSLYSYGITTFYINTNTIRGYIKSE